MSANMSNVLCPNCNHPAEWHKAENDKCLECSCLFDPKQILLEKINDTAAELAALRAEVARKTKLLKEFMDSQDSDWWEECGDWKDNEWFTTSVPIGLIRRIDEELQK